MAVVVLGEITSYKSAGDSFVYLGNQCNKKQMQEEAINCQKGIMIQIYK